MSFLGVGAKAAIRKLTFSDPFLTFVNPLTMTYANEPVDTTSEDSTYAVAFCLALRLMSEEPAGDLGPGWPAASTPWARRRKDLIRYLMQPLYFPDEGSNPIACYSPTMLMHKRGQALTTAGLFSVILRETIANGRIVRMHIPSGEMLSIAVPTSTSIPFHLMMDVPLPFSPGAEMELASCHLAKMTTAGFLEDGEWAGFYSTSYGARGGPANFDPPMHGIRFATTTNSDSSATIDLHATGEDGVGTFSLDGKLLPVTGQMTFTKRYFGGFPKWDWACLMTPVGIVGSWGPNGYGGWIWLWKTGWSVGR